MDKRKKFNIILGVINALLLAAAGILALRINSLKNNYSCDSAKKMWDGNKYTYSQISLYFGPLSGLEADGIYSLRSSVNDKLKEASILGNKDNPPGRLWIDCAGGQSTITAYGSVGSSEIIASGTFGDYFLFHPEPLMYGGYYADDDINIDRIILDREASWRLFGSMDTVGMPVTVENKTFYVAGVVKSPDSNRDKECYGTVPRAYLPYESLREIKGGLSLTIYEACIPNAVKDYAYKVMEEINPAKENSVLIDQSGRFGFIKLIKDSREIYKSVISDSYRAYPWYENRTRCAELLARMAALPLPYLLIIPAFSLVYLLFALTKLLGKGAWAIKGKAEERYQAKISEEYRKKRQSQQ